MIYFLFLTLFHDQCYAEEIYERTIVSEEKVIELKLKYKNSSYDDLFHPIREAVKSIRDETETYLPPKVNPNKNLPK